MNRRRTKRSRGRYAAIAMLVGASLTGGAMVATMTEAAGTSATASSVAETSAPIPAALINDFGVLREASSAAPTQGDFEGLASFQGVDPNEARLVMTDPAAGVALWLVPGPENSCVATVNTFQVSNGAGFASTPEPMVRGGCAPNSVAESQGVFVTIAPGRHLAGSQSTGAAPAGDVTLAGVVPDGVNSVAVGSGGEQTPLTVTNNGVMGQVSPAATLELTAVDGSTTAVTLTTP